MDKREKKILLDYIVSCIETKVNDDFEGFATCIYLLDELEKEKDKYLKKLTKSLDFLS